MRDDEMRLMSRVALLITFSRLKQQIFTRMS